MLHLHFGELSQLYMLTKVINERLCAIFLKWQITLIKLLRFAPHHHRKKLMILMQKRNHILIILHYRALILMFFFFQFI